MLVDVNGVSELMGEVKSDQLDVTASVSTTTTTHTDHTGRSQPHAFCRGQIVSHHDRADKQRSFPQSDTVLHFLQLQLQVAEEEEEDALTLDADPNAAIGFDDT